MNDDSRDNSTHQQEGQREQDGKEEQKKRRNRESSIRWQANTIQQLGHANNLLLTFAVATIGVEFKFLIDLKAPLACWSLFGFAASILLLGVSFALGLSVVINRLRDFRETAHAARAREDGDSIKNAMHSEAAKKLGDKTWCRFTAQIWTFGIGLLAGVITLAVLVLNRVY